MITLKLSRELNSKAALYKGSVRNYYSNLSALVEHYAYLPSKMRPEISLLEKIAYEISEESDNQINKEN